MRLVWRVLGWIFAAAALVLLLGDVIAWRQMGSFALRSLGLVWRNLDVASLNGLQVVLERYLWPPLWSDLVFPLLLLPGAPLAALLALVFLLLGRRRRGGGRLFGR